MHKERISSVKGNHESQINTHFLSSKTFPRPQQATLAQNTHNTSTHCIAKVFTPFKIFTPCQITMNVRFWDFM